MKKSLLFLLPTIYSGFMLYRSPNISDALIVASLAALAGFIFYVNIKHGTADRGVNEITKLEEELHIERLRIGVEQVRENARNEKLARDARNAAMSGVDGRQIKF